MANKLNTIFLRLANRPIGFLHNTPNIKNYTLPKHFGALIELTARNSCVICISYPYQLHSDFTFKSSYLKIKHGISYNCQSMFSPPSYWTYRWSRCKSEVSFKTSNYITQFLLAQVRDTFCTHCSSQNPKMCLPWICIIIGSKFVIPIAGSKFRSFQ